jgi:hypothetical protein
MSNFFAIIGILRGGQALQRPACLNFAAPPPPGTVSKPLSAPFIAIDALLNAVCNVPNGRCA